MDFLYLISYACPRLLFLDVETNPLPRLPVAAVCRILCSNVLGLAGNHSYLTVASSHYDIPLCSETGLRYAARVGDTGSRIRSTCLVVPRQDASGPRDGRGGPEMVTDHFVNPNLGVVVAKCWFLGCVV